MATKNLRITNGVRIWWKTATPTVIWTELGKKKADAFLSTAGLGKLFLKLIPFVGDVLYGIKKAELEDAEDERGPNGLWVKSSVGKFKRVYRARTSANMQKAPAPW